MGVGSTKDCRCRRPDRATGLCLCIAHTWQGRRARDVPWLCLVGQGKQVGVTLQQVQNFRLPAGSRTCKVRGRGISNWCLFFPSSDARSVLFGNRTKGSHRTAHLILRSINQPTKLKVKARSRIGEHMICSWGIKENRGLHQIFKNAAFACIPFLEGSDYPRRLLPIITFSCNHLFKTKVSLKLHASLGFRFPRFSFFFEVSQNCSRKAVKSQYCRVR